MNPVEKYESEFKMAKTHLPHHQQLPTDRAARWDLLLPPWIPSTPSPRLKWPLAWNKGNSPRSQKGIPSPSLLPWTTPCSGHKDWRSSSGKRHQAHWFPGAQETPRTRPLAMPINAPINILQAKRKLRTHCHYSMLEYALWIALRI